MFVCICNQVTDKQIRRSVAEGHCTLEALRAELNVGACCGKCKTCARKVLHSAMLENACHQAAPSALKPSLSAA